MVSFMCKICHQREDAQYHDYHGHNHFPTRYDLDILLYYICIYTYIHLQCGLVGVHDQLLSGMIQIAAWGYEICNFGGWSNIDSEMS